MALELEELETDELSTKGRAWNWKFYRKNCGPPTSIASVTGPLTRNVNSFSIGSGKRCGKYDSIVMFYSKT